MYKKISQLTIKLIDFIYIILVFGRVKIKPSVEFNCR